MKSEFEVLKNKIYERKSWLDTINSLNEVSIAELRLWENLDNNHCIKILERNEKEYQALLLILRAVQIDTLQNNAVPIGDLQGIQQIIDTTENNPPTLPILN